MPRKSHEFVDGRCVRCGDREDRAGDLCFLTDWESDEIDFEDGLVNAARAYWWDDMRAHEVRQLVIDAYMQGRIMAPLCSLDRLHDERDWYRNERDRLRQHLIDEGREDLTEEPDRDYYKRRACPNK